MLIKLFRYCTVIFPAIMVLSSCEKHTVDRLVPPPQGYFGNIKYVFQYNPAQFGGIYNYLALEGLTDTLATPGPFTVLAYDNNAVLNFLPGPMSNYIIAGLTKVREIGPGQSASVTAINGYRIFLDAFVRDGDTTYTANGSLLRVVDQGANNGMVDVMARIVSPQYYPNPMYYIRSVPSLSAFAYALQRAHLDTLLQDSTKEFTVLAPTNEGMAGVGLGFEAISQTDPDSLADNFLKFHILLGRNFLYSYNVRYGGDGSNPDTLSVPTLSGLPMQVIVSPGGYMDPLYTLPVFMGNPASSAGMDVYARTYDLPAGRSVVHIIQGALIPQ